jgi:hypothetical protein
MREGFSAKEFSAALGVAPTAVTRVTRKVFAFWADAVLEHPDRAYRDLATAMEMVRSERESAAHPLLAKLAKLSVADPLSFAIESHQALRSARIDRDRAVQSPPNRRSRQVVA